MSRGREFAVHLPFFFSFFFSFFTAICSVGKIHFCFFLQKGSLMTQVYGMATPWIPLRRLKAAGRVLECDVYPDLCIRYSQCV
jgi:hypothetical protein